MAPPKKKRKSRKNMHYFFLDIGGKQPIRLGVKARNATQRVILSRNIIDVMRGTKGMSITCANALCALRLGTNVFPHPVIMAEFTDTRCYIVDKLSQRGVPTHCVVYSHDQGEFQREFDDKTKQRLSKMSDVEKLFVLTPPPILPEVKNAHGQGRKNPKAGGPSGTSYSARNAKKSGFSKGAVARALRAGIVLNVKKVKEEEAA